MEYREDWDTSKKRFSAFWNQELVDRCCISVIAPKRGMEERYKELTSYPRLYGWGDPEAIARKSRAQFEVTRFGGEAFPGIWLNLGPSGHAGYFSGAHYHMDEQTVWYTPTIGDEYRDVNFDRQSELYKLTLSMAQYFVDDSRGDYYISMPDTSGNFDALAYLRGNENVLMDIACGSEEIFSALNEIQRAWEHIIKDVYAIVRANNDGGSVIYWLKTWAPGLHSQLQADLSVMISNQDYKRYIMPELRAQTEFLEYPLYHFDGAEQVRHLDDLLALQQLKAIQWMSVAGQKPPSHYIDVLQKIQEQGKSLVISIYDTKEVEPLLTQLSSKGLYLVLEAQDEDELEAIMGMTKRLTHE